MIWIKKLAMQFFKRNFTNRSAAKLAQKGKSIFEQH